MIENLHKEIKIALEAQKRWKDTVEVDPLDYFAIEHLREATQRLNDLISDRTLYQAHLDACSTSGSSATIR